MNPSRICSWALAAWGALGSMLATAPAQAAVTLYSDAASFAAVLSTTDVDALDDVPVGRLDPGLVLSRPGYTVSTTAGELENVLYSLAADTGVGTGGEADHWLSTWRADAPLVFSNFQNPRALGFNAFGTTSQGGVADQSLLEITAIEANGANWQFTISASNAHSFVGLVSDGGGLQLVTLVIRNSAVTYPTVNNVTTTTSLVPEPSAYALMLGGLAALLAYSWRRRQS